MGVWWRHSSAELAFGDDAGVGPAVLDGLQPPGQVVVVADGDLPDGGDPAEAVEGVAAVEVDGGGVEHLFAADGDAEVLDGFDGADAHAAVEAALEAVAAGGEEVAGPAVEADAVDEVGGALGGLEVVLAAGVVGVADAAVAVAVVDAVLAPDLALADVDAFFGGEEVLVFCVHEAGDEGLWAVVVAYHVGDELEGLVDGGLDLVAGVVHGREVAAGDEGDLVAVAVVVGGEEAAGVDVLLALVVEGQPADGPGHAAVGAAAGEGFAAGADVGGGVGGGLVLADVAGGGDFDLVYADDGDVGYEAALQWSGRGWEREGVGGLRG